MLDRGDVMARLKPLASLHEPPHLYVCARFFICVGVCARVEGARARARARAMTVQTVPCRRLTSPTREPPRGAVLVSR